MDLVNIFFANWILFIVIFACIGGAIGNTKGRPLAGALWSLVLGPLGWILIAVLPSELPKCPACKGDIVAGATKCKNCGSDLPK